jgi:L-amino acid N-acyltransferase YncA
MRLRQTRLWPLLRFLRRGIFTIELKDVFEVEIKGLLEQAPRPTELVFRVADFSDIQSLGPAFAHEYDTDALAFVETRLRVGDKAVVGYLDEHPVFSGWSMFGYMELSRDEYLPIPDHVVCVYKLFTIASMRRQGVLAAFYRYWAGVLDGLGYTRIRAAVFRVNSTSMVAHQKLGFKRVGSIRTVGILGRYRSQYTIDSRSR